MTTLLEHLRLRAARGLYEMALSQSQSPHVQTTDRFTEPSNPPKPSNTSPVGVSRTYTLSELSGRQWKRFNRYKFKRLGQFSRNRAQLERLYRDVGKAFYCLPVGVRSVLMGDSNLVFIFMGDAANPEPLITGQLREFREVFEEFRHHVLVTHDMRRAKKVFHAAGTLLEDIKDNMLHTTHQLKVRVERYFSNYDQNDFPDEGLPRLAADGTTATSHQAKLAEIRTWLSDLPEVKNAVKNGFITIDQELQDFLRGFQQEEHRLDAEDLEFSDMESCSDHEDNDDDEEEEEDVANGKRSYGPLVPASWTPEDA